MDYYIPLSSDVREWDIKKKIVFIEDCYWMRQDRDFLQTLDYEVLDVNDFSINQIDEGKLWVFRCQLSKAIGKIMNDYHHLEFSELYWRRVLGLWLKDFIEFVYIRFLRLFRLREKYEGERLFVKIFPQNQSETFVVDPRELFRKMWFSEAYAHQVYSYIIATFWQDDFEIQYCSNISDNTTNSTNLNVQENSNLANGLWNKLRKYSFEEIICKVGVCFFDLIAQCHAAFCHKILSIEPELLCFFSVGKHRAYKLSWANKGKVVAFDNGNLTDIYVSESRSKDTEFRNEMITRLSKLSFNIENRDLLSAILSLAARDMPMAYVENFEQYRNVFKGVFSRYPKLRYIISNAGALFLAPLLAMAEQSEAGVKYTYFWHGFCIGEYYIRKELLYADIVYPWGNWSNEFHAACFRAAPSEMMQQQYDNIEAVTSRDIVFVGDSNALIHPLIRKPALGNYYQTIKNFVSSLSEEVFNHIVIRNYPWDFGRMIDRWLLEEYPSLRFSRDKERDNDKSSFPKLVHSAKLLILDHVETPFAEVLYVRKPFILFFPRKHTEYYFKTGEKKYVDMMHEVGILHYSPESAAEYVNQIYYHVEDWWNEPERQRVVSILRDRYTPPKVDDIDQWWVDEIKSLLHGGV